MNLLGRLAERLIRAAGADATNDLLRSLLRDYEHLSYRRLRAIGFDPATIFDVGAFRGDWSREARKIFPEARIVMIEAQPSMREALERVARDIHNASVHGSLLSAEAEQDVKFYAMGTGSSIRPERSDAPRDVLHVASTTFDDIWNVECPVTAPVFVKIDVQGAELDVLRGAAKSIAQVEWIQLECALLPYNEGAPQLREVCEFMADHGFHPTEITGFSRPRRHLVQVDLLFARAGSVLRPETFVF